MLAGASNQVVCPPNPTALTLAGRYCSLAQSGTAQTYPGSLLYAGKCYGLAQLSLPLDLAHTNADESDSLA